MKMDDRQTDKGAGGQPRPLNRDFSASLAGVFLIFTAILTLAAVVTRVSASADQPTLAETLSAIADNRVLYGAGGAARLVSGVTLLLAGWFLVHTWVIRQGFGHPLAPTLLALSGVVTAISGGCALALSISAQSDAGVGSIGATTEVVATARSLTGKIGFTLAGLALVVAARQQWTAGTPLNRIAPLSGIIGAAMLFIWWDSATIMHRISGVAFLLWLVLIGIMLVTGRVERHFIAKVVSGPRVQPVLHD